jgi:hypothetical protein
MFRLCLALMLTLATLPTLAADDPDIRQLMTAEDAAEMIKASPAVKEITRGDVRSRIDGEFNGWNGRTRFPL